MSSSSTSTRPLEQIRRDTKAANRAPHLRKKNFVGADPIDVLDNVGIGGAYHHGGPYDATLAQRNRDARYAPVAAVKESNMEALRATPQEYVQDSLRKHVPLQGTATIPPGMKDYAGRRMNYKEGADLMREPDAPGGPYKRYEHIKYHPDDLKGKGEPSYTIERDLKERKHAAHKKTQSTNGSSRHRHSTQTHEYEMQPATVYSTSSHTKNDSHARVRSRSYSVGTDSSLSSNLRVDNTSQRHRSGSTGKRISEGRKSPPVYVVLLKLDILIMSFVLL
ncbi:hypothetical protein F4775DRAFT_135471 [Biscogniauxia sp. FL1348]|nr:hypothetical protein F4775DRAFT_135471 [Biscogniauxia sp. FL1348]